MANQQCYSIVRVCTRPHARYTGAAPAWTHAPQLLNITQQPAYSEAAHVRQRAPAQPQQHSRATPAPTKVRLTQGSPPPLRSPGHHRPHTIDVETSSKIDRRSTADPVRAQPCTPSGHCRSTAPSSQAASHNHALRGWSHLRCAPIQQHPPAWTCTPRQRRVA